MRAKYIMTDHLATMLHIGVRQTGSFDPDEVLPYIEERLTIAEVQTAEKFLGWVNEDRDRRCFGSANLDHRFQDFVRSV